MTDEAEAIVVICPVCGLPAGTVGPSCYLDSVGCTRAVMTDEAEALKPCPREPDEAMPRETFEQALAHAINCHSMENDSDTPDFVLAEFLRLCLTAWNYGIVGRERYYQRNVAVPIPPSAAPKSLEIPREIAALRELVAVKDAEAAASAELDKVPFTADDVAYDRARTVPSDLRAKIDSLAAAYEKAWAAARAALAMYDQERG